MIRATIFALLVASLAVVYIGAIDPLTEEETREALKSTDVQKLIRKFRGMEGSEVGDYGPLEDNLIEWIETRAGILFDRIYRYRSELEDATMGNRIVIEILLLNTLADLEALINMNLKSLSWLRQKYEVVLDSNVNKNEVDAEVIRYAHYLIVENEGIEQRLRGTNNPGVSWSKNTNGLYRIYMEQRFSKDLHETIETYLKGQFNRMLRATVFNQNPPKDLVSHGLYYQRAKGIVPGYFPFSAQDAIARGDIDV